MIYKKNTKTEYEAEDEYKLLIEKLSKICQPNDIFKVKKLMTKKLFILISQRNKKIELQKYHNKIFYNE